MVRLSSKVFLPVLALSAFFVLRGTAQGSPQAKPSHAAPQHAAASVSAARLDMLSRLEATAVQSGEASQVERSARELNAEALALLATIAAGETRTAEAVTLDRESLVQYPTVDVKLRLADLLARTGEHEEAVQLAREATGEEPQNPKAYTTLASALRTAHRDREAVEPLTRALALDQSPSIAFALGSALLAVHDKPAADRIFQQLLAASDGSAIWHVAVGDAYREADYLTEAAAEFRKALSIDAHATHAEFFLGLVSLQMNEWGPNSESFLHLRRSVEQNPREYLSNFYLGALESTDGSDLASSDRHLQAAKEADATQPEVWIYLGQNAQREHRNAQAIEYLRKAIQLTGNDESRNHFQVRRAYFALGRLLLADGKRDEGEQYLADYRRTGAASAAQATASIAEQQGRAAAAAPAVDAPEASLQALAGNAVAAQAAPPTQVSVSPQLRSAEAQLRTLLAGSYNDLGTAEAHQQQYAAALHSFQQAERFGNPSPALLRNIATAAYRLNDSREVVRALDRYFSATPPPNDARAHLMLAMADFDQGRFAPAVQSFAAAGDSVDADPRTLYSNAYALARTGEAQKATLLADKLTASDLPVNYLALVCDVYFVAENYEASRRCYTNVTRQAPTLPRAQYFIGESLIHLDRPAEAVAALQAEFALTPGEPNVASSLAFALTQTGQKDKAQDLLQTTVGSHPDHAEAQYQLGKLLAEQGKTAEAIPHLEASVARDGSRDYAHYQLATAYRKAGRKEDAEREFARYREIKEVHRNDRAIPNTSQGQPVLH